MQSLIMMMSIMCFSLLLANQNNEKLMTQSDPMGNWRFSAGGFGRGNIRTDSFYSTSDRAQVYGADMDVQYKIPRRFVQQAKELISSKWKGVRLFRFADDSIMIACRHHMRFRPQMKNRKYGRFLVKIPIDKAVSKNYSKLRQVLRLPQSANYGHRNIYSVSNDFGSRRKSKRPIYAMPVSS